MANRPAAYKHFKSEVSLADFAHIKDSRVEIALHRTVQRER